MKISKHSLLLAFVSLFLLTGCANMNWANAATAGVHIKLLDSEWERAIAVIDATPLNESERAVMDSVIAKLNPMRQELRTMHKRSAARIAMSTLQAQTFLDTATAEFIRGRDAYIGYLERTGAPPDPMLAATYESAVISRDNAQAAIDSGQGLTAGQAAGHLALVLRALALVNGVPA